MFLKSFWTKIILGIFSAIALCGCNSVSYYHHLISGQIAILNKKQPIKQIVTDPYVSADLKNKLNLVQQVREFAKNELHLPVKHHYLSFVQLDRPFVLWNVYATPEFSFRPKTWCYPFVGCTAYRGYFSQHKAHEYADKLKEQGYDVFTGGVAAYSTLGWFDDPVLSTFIHRSNIKLTALLFHELAHQILFVEDDTTFNESFATTVEQEGIRRWLKTKNSLDSFREYQVDYRRHRQFLQLIATYRNKLDLLYAENMPAVNKRQVKASLFEELRDEYSLLKQHWEGYTGYDPWFNHKLNNAQLLSVSTYHDLVPAFLQLLKNNGNDLKLLYKYCQTLAKKSKKERLDIIWEATNVNKE
jgi:predicted aminopeptidase